MKTITIGFGICAAAAAFGSAAGQSLPFVTFEWSLAARYDFCSGCAEGCVRPGGLCIREQSFRIESDGTIQNLGSCPVSPSGLGELAVSTHLVTFTGSFVDTNALGVCGADCCWNNDCLCGSGPLEFEPERFVMTFSRPVWFGWGNGVTGSNGMTTAPETSTSLFYPPVHLQYTSERADFDADGLVDGADLARLLESWMGCEKGGCFSRGRMDLNDDGQIDGSDLGLLLLRWGQVS